MSKPSTGDGGSHRSPIGSERLDAVFGALAHPARRRILIVLHARGGEMTAGEINDRFRHSWPTTTRHLGVLRNAGLLKSEERGRHRLYSLERQDLERTVDWLAAWVTGTGPARRAEWSDLPYATMRNATPPDGAADAPGAERPEASDEEETD